MKMKLVRIGNMKVVMCAADYAKQQGYPAYWTWGDLAVVSPINGEDIAQMIGLDIRKADFALPQAWADKHPDYHKYVWYYGNPDTHLFGEPVNVYERFEALGAVVHEQYMAAKERGD
jgi:hypothetical protein